MTLLKFFQIFMVVGGIACGQILFKLSAEAINTETNMLRLLYNPHLIFAFILYGGCTVLWVYLLRDIELNKAYPVFSLSFLIVPLLSWAILGEAINKQTIIGAMLIMSGVYIMCFQE